jgi:hypothetical protein
MSLILFASFTDDLMDGVKTWFFIFNNNVVNLDMVGEFLYANVWFELDICWSEASSYKRIYTSCNCGKNLTYSGEELNLQGGPNKKRVGGRWMELKMQ